MASRLEGVQVEGAASNMTSSGSGLPVSLHLESYTPGQDQAKSYVPVCTGMYRYVLVYASTGILVQYILVCTAMYKKHDMKVSHTCRQLFESKLKQRTAPRQEIC